MITTEDLELDDHSEVVVVEEVTIAREGAAMTEEIGKRDQEVAHSEIVGATAIHVEMVAVAIGKNYFLFLSIFL